jgi:hypothetical protein
MFILRCNSNFFIQEKLFAFKKSLLMEKTLGLKSELQIYFKAQRVTQINIFNDIPRLKLVNSSFRPELLFIFIKALSSLSITKYEHSSITVVICFSDETDDGRNGPGQDCSGVSRFLCSPPGITLSSRCLKQLQYHFLKCSTFLF